MAFKKRESKTMTAANQRLAGLKAIDPTGNLDLGNGITYQSFEAEIKGLDDAVGEHNEALSVADKKGNRVKEKEKSVKKLASKVLTAVGLKYGLDSDEYEQAGGTRESERKLGRKMVPANPTKKAPNA